MPVRATKRGAARVPFPTRCRCRRPDLRRIVRRADRGARTASRPEPGCWCSIATRSASARRRPAPLPRSGCATSVSRPRSGRRSTRCWSTRRRVERARWPLPFTFSTFDYRQLCDAACSSRAARPSSRRRRSSDRTGNTVHTDRGDVTAPLIVDALGWRRVLGPGDNVQPPDAPLSRGLEVHPAGAGEDLELWIDPRYVDAGYGWSFPARDELRIGVGSFDPHDPVKQPTLRLRRGRRRRAATATRATGSRTASGRRPRTACSSPATARGTACR